MHKGLFAALAAAMVMLGCSSSDKGGVPQSGDGGSGGGNTPQERPKGVLEGKAVDALIIGGTLSVYSWENGVKGQLLGSTITDQTGNYSLSIQTPSKPVLLELVGGHYIEEASGRRVDLNSRHKLRAVTYYESGQSLSVMVTPWTNVAAAFAQYQMRTQGLNANNAITSSASALAAIVDVDILNTVPWDVTHESSESIFTDELKYGITLAAASSLTAWASEQNGLQPHTTYTSINLAEMMYLDVLADGVLNGNGYRITADGSPSDQVVTYSLGRVPVNVELYRRQLALEMLKVASAEYNKTQMTIDDVFSNADRYSMSTHMIWSPEAPVPIDLAGPVIAPQVVAGRVLGGNVSIPVTVTDLLSVKRVDYYLDGEFLVSISDQKSMNVEIDTTEYADGEHELHIEAWDSLENKGETTIKLKFDNSGPSLTIADNLLTNKNSFLLTGTASDSTNSGLSVTANDKVASLNNGKWQIEIPITQDVTPVVVVAKDGLGNATEQNIEIKKDSVAPSLEPIFSEARFFTESVGIVVNDLDKSDGLPVYFDLGSLSLGGLEVTETSLLENGIPYIRIATSDVGFVSTKPETIEVKYQVLRNGNALNDWRDLALQSIENGIAYYLLPFSSEFLSEKWINSKATDALTAHIITSDEAGNSKDYKFTFSSYINFPRLHINSQYIRSNITAYEYLSDGNLGGIVGECVTDDLGYCQVAVAGDVDNIQIRANGGQYIEPATGDATDVGTVKTYAQFLGDDLVVYMHPLSPLFSAMVERVDDVGEGVETFVEIYGFHPYATKPEKLSNITTLTDGVKLSLQLRGISEFATTHGGSSAEFATLMAQDYSSDGLLDGMAILQVDPERLEFYGQPITANTYRTDVPFAALLAVENRGVVYDYLNGIATDTNAIYGDEEPVSLDVEGPTVEVVAALSWAKTVELKYQATDVSAITGVSIHIDNMPYAHSSAASGVFSVDSTEIADGQHTLSIIAVDAIGNATEWRKTIVVDNTAPVVTLKAPAAAAATSFTITVDITDITAVSDPVLLIDGEAAGQRAVLSEKGFTLNPSTLDDGSHTFTVRATDALGNVGSKDAVVLIDKTAPVLKITSSPLVNKVDYKVTGTVADSTKVTVTVNGKAATVSEGKWEYVAKLSAFQTVFDVVAVDAVGNKTEAEIKVDYDDSAPGIKWIASSGEYRTEFGSVFSVNSLVNAYEPSMNIPVTLVSIGRTEWNSSAIDLAGYMYVEPVITDPTTPGSTASAELLVETRYVEDDEVVRDWQKWTRTSRTMPFVTEVLAPGWENSGDDVIRKLEVRATDKAGNVSEIATWEFKVHIVRDFVAPTVTPARTLVKFTKGDGVLANCTSGELLVNNSVSKPICLDTSRIALGGKKVTPQLSNEGYAAVEVQVEDPYGEGFFTEAKDLVVEYQYLRGDTVVMDWTPAPRQESAPKTVYLPLVTETLGKQFFVADKATVHKVAFRVADSEGNSSSATFDIALDVLTQELEVGSPEPGNEEIFKKDFEQRALLNGDEAEIHYDFTNQTDVPYVISFESAAKNKLTHVWESAQRVNRARIIEKEEWRVQLCMNCLSDGTPPIPTGGIAGFPKFAEPIEWSSWLTVTGLYDRSNKMHSPATREPAFTNYQQDVVVAADVDWTDYVPPGLCESNTEPDARPSTAARYACPVGYANNIPSLKQVERRIQRRVFKTVEYDEGYPKNQIEALQKATEFGDSYRVFDLDAETEIIPVGGWFKIPVKTSIRIVKVSKLPSVINKDDPEVLANDETVPYLAPVYHDKSLTYSLNTDMIISRAIDAGGLDKVSVSKQAIGEGIVSFEVRR